MNEKFLNIVLVIVLSIGAFFLIQQCQGRGAQQSKSFKFQDQLVVVPVRPDDAAGAEANLPAAVPVDDKGPQGRQPPAKPQKLTIGGADASSPYKLEVTLDNVAAGVDRVRLNVKEFAQTTARKEPLELFKADPRLLTPYSVMAIHVQGFAESLDERRDTWEPIEKTARHVTFRRRIFSKSDADTPTAEIRRTFAVDPASHYLTITNTLRNWRPEPLEIRLDQMTSENLPQDNVQNDLRSVQAARYFANGQFISEKVSQCFYDLQLSSAVKGMEEIGAFGGTGDHVVWTAQSNRFFTQIIRPEGRAGAPTVKLNLPPHELKVLDWLSKAEVLTLAHDKAQLDQSPIGVRYIGAPVKLEGNGRVDLSLKVYLGPKDRHLLAGDPSKPVTSEEFLRQAYHYSTVINYAQVGCSFCTFDQIVLPILWLLDKIELVVRNYGIAILVLTLVVRLLLHPLSRMAQVNMAVMQKKMAAIQPELKKAEKRYEKDKQALAAEKMRIMREHNVNPAGQILGCLPMFLQMPIWVALWAGLATDIALRHAPFIPGWINDLSNPDTVYSIPLSFALPVLGLTHNGQHYLPINVLPLLLAVAYFVQMKIQLATSPPPADEQQAQTQKISSYMMLIIPLFFYNAASGMNVYMLASTAGGLFDTWLIRKSLRARGILPAGPAVTT